MAMMHSNITATNNYSRNDNHQECSIKNVISLGQVFLPVFYSIVFIVGVVGNGLVVCVLVKFKRIFKMSDMCLLNLAISDLLFLISLPFWAHYAAINEWTFGGFMCHAMTALYMLGFYGSIFFIILMTVDRYALIVHTYTCFFSKYRSARASIALTLFMWTLSLATSLPTIIFSKVMNTSGNCICMLDYPQETAWESFSYIEMNLSFIISLLVMVLCYSRIIHVLLDIKTQKKHKVIRLMMVVVSIFFLFWAPYNIVIFLQFLHRLGYMQTCKWYQDLNMALSWVEAIAFSHCCINPLIYALVGQKFRNLFLKILKEWFPFCFGRCTMT